MPLMGTTEIKKFIFQIYSNKIAVIEIQFAAVITIYYLKIDINASPERLIDHFNARLCAI